jgi:hypothetical protein
VENILHKPDRISSGISLLDLANYDFLLQVEAYSSPLDRHEALARALGICSGLVLGLNYCQKLRFRSTLLEMNRLIKNSFRARQLKITP